MSHAPDAAHANLEHLAQQLTKEVQRVDKARIKELVNTIVDRMRSEGAPPERVVIAVKSAIVSGLNPIASPDPAKRTDSERLLRDYLGWCLQRYYVLND
jgi:hypothetical protein